MKNKTCTTHSKQAHNCKTTAFPDPGSTITRSVAGEHENPAAAMAPGLLFCPALHHKQWKHCRPEHSAALCPKQHEAAASKRNHENQQAPAALHHSSTKATARRSEIGPYIDCGLLFYAPFFWRSKRKERKTSITLLQD
jgi:hypothetical protein